jgi:hypothetical protein
MTSDRSRAGGTTGVVAWLGGMLMAFEAGEESRVWHVIASAAARAREADHLDPQFRQRAGHEPN